MKIMIENVIRKIKPRALFRYKDCIIWYFSFDGEVYDQIQLSQYSHIWTRGLANYRGRALTTGCNGYGECSFKTEFLDMTTLRWSAGTDFPFGDRDK